MPPAAVDAVIVVVLTALAVYQALALPAGEVGSHGRRGFAAAYVAAALLLMLRRHLPLLSLAAVVAVVSLAPSFGVPYANSGFFIVNVACYSQACYTRRAPVWLGWSLTLFVPLGITMAVPSAARLAVLREFWPAIALTELLFALGSYAGHLQRQRRVAAASLAERALRLRDAPTALAELDVADERGRIARDLQQIVVHAVEQVRSRLADAVRAARRAGPKAERSIDEVAAAGRSALVEMRRLLGVLRVDSGAAPEAVVDVARLRAEAAGAGVVLTVDLPALLDEQPAAVRNAVRRFVEVAVETAARTDAAGALRVEVVATLDALRLRSEPVGPLRGLQASTLPPWDPALSALAERFRVLGGELEVSWPGSCPLLIASVPLNAGVDVELARDERAPDPALAAAVATRVAGGWRRRISPPVFDLVAALVVCGLGIGQMLLQKPTPHLPVPDQVAPGVAVMTAFAASLLVRRRWPLAGFAVVSALTLLIGLPSVRKSDAIQVVIVMYLFEIASRYPTRVTVIAAAVALLAEIPHMVRVDWTCLCVIVVLSIVGSGTATGRVARRLNLLNATLRSWLQDVTRERDVEAQLAVSEERRRIAREMHDLVAHRLSVLVIQSGAAASLIRRDAPRAREMLAEVGESFEPLVDELHALLGHVTADEAVPADLSSIIRDGSRAGLTIDLVDDAGDDATASARAAAYRIVQESLTNAAKHAPGADVSVRLHRDRTGLHIEVRNTAPRQASGSSVESVGAGHGLIGIRERVLAFTGSFDARPDPDGGFTLRASLPEPAAV
ncbi:MAG TPA: histidine kinase [Mycobacteriales bacterium]|nr:histidine kinase [Mycobacteriales bacterium]